MLRKFGISAGLVACTFALLPSASAAELPVYVLASNAAVSVSVLATSGDTLNGQVLRGVPDGQGVIKNSDGTLTLLSNHEISISDPRVIALKKDTGTWGSSISKFTFDVATQKFTKLEQFISSMKYFNYKTGTYSDSSIGTAPFGAPEKDSFGTELFSNGLNRFCSSNLVQAGGLSYSEKDKSGKTIKYGYSDAVYFTTEEGGDNSRAFGFDMKGNGIQLPRLGLASYENFLLNPSSGKTTFGMINEDGSATASQLSVYVGTKLKTGANFAEKAGLTNGSLYSVSVKDIRTDNIFRTTKKVGEKVAFGYNKTNWDPSFGDTAAQAQANGTTFARVEDGEWDPKNPNIYYFLTTESNKDPVATASNPATPTVSRDGGALWKMTFKDAKNPLLGGTIEMLLNGGEALMLSKPDNLAVDEAGYILIQEDPGNNAHRARVLAYRLSDAKLAVVAQFDEKLFDGASTSLMTIDEESSGVINMNQFMKKSGDKSSYFFFNAQVHTTITKSRPDLSASADLATLDATAFEGGQYYMLNISDWTKLFE